MGNQFEGLLLEVSKEVAGAVVRIEEARRQLDDLTREVGTMRQKFAALEEAKKWTGAERRRVAGRLESGDQTFVLLRQQIADAEAASAQALKEVGTIRDAMAKKVERPRGFWPTVKKKAIEAFVPFAISTVGAAIVSGAAWLYYHLTFLHELAEAAKKAGGKP